MIASWRSKLSRLLKNRVEAPDGEGALPVRHSLIPSR
jgi:hypothetical protein